MFRYVYLTFFETRYPHLQQRYLQAITLCYMRMLDLYGTTLRWISVVIVTLLFYFLQSPVHTTGRGFPGTTTNGTVSPKAKRTYLPQPKEMFAIAHNMTRAHDSFFKLCPLVCGLGICYALHFLFPTFVVQTYKCSVPCMVPDLV